MSREDGVVDCDERLARLEEHLQWVSDRASGAEVRLYRRVSSSIRVERREDGTWSARRGAEEGTALELRNAGESRGRFAAASGGSRDAVSCLVDLITGSTGVEWAAFPGAQTIDSGQCDDRDQDLSLPEPARLRPWLDAAFGRLSPRLRAIWIEVAATVESWAGSDGLRASRARCRGWCLARPAGPERPALIAARRWRDLDADHLEILLDDRIAPGHGHRDPELPPVWLFTPECSATLVAALTRRIHGDAAGLTHQVGPGWCLADRAADPRSLFGGAFDDLGWPTRSTTLADGRTVCSVIAGPGVYRRPAFRDPPLPAPAHLVMQPPSLEAPPRFTLVSDLSLHPLPGDRWMLEVAGLRFEGGQACDRFRRCALATSPWRLVESCAGAVGAARASFRGVTTPGLLFDAPHAS